MKILVDADACPVKNIIVKIGKEYNLNILMFIDTSHIINDGYSNVITVDKGRDSVDIALINKVNKDDIVVTQDYGLASMALSKKALVINQNGLVYTNDNIDMLLFQRHLSQKSRQAGIKTKKTKKRTKQNNEMFEENFRNLCRISLNQK
ncbi:YaiI/YqxD family protein [Tepidibacter formicigenes]|jgi:uncharacterized protein YaiI (UPF0178 family)|uniref:UPF0178 protein SAMN02744037_00286 n=1 Tax=Tepidibacter formicigenes DSM 15518 TaxID=1123349 RepID=A0A1M6K4P8_9FIRM|nr:YaiI/YqxD family protein [Tepidibacter formicigenes]SHJ53891.1 hypothetical protein SAMN02744037_00286 [Tepidibacter formicigenes DSM 15518]